VTVWKKTIVLLLPLATLNESSYIYSEITMVCSNHVLRGSREGRFLRQYGSRRLEQLQEFLRGKEASGRFREVLKGIAEVARQLWDGL